MSLGTMSGQLCVESGRQRITWKIPGLFQLTSQKLLSPEFRFADVRYFLKLYPTEFEKLTEKDSIVVKVERKSGPDPGRGVSFEVGLKTSTGKDIHMHRCTSTGDINPSHLRLFLIKRREFEKNRYSYAPDGTLTIFCSMSMGELSHSSQEQAGLAKLQWDYRQLLEKEADSDTCLVVSGKKFRAHRCVLRARSNVFNAMFGHKTAEKNKGQVVINDLNPDSFVHFLEYLYTGDVQACLSDDNVFEMYKAADKYDVTTLKSECVARMLRTLSVDSFCEVMTLTLRHSEEGLRQKVVEFFKENLQRIIVTPKWEQFIDSNGKGVNELLVQAFVPLEKMRPGKSSC